MLHNYTVVLQSKQHRPRRFRTQAQTLSDVVTKLKKTKMFEHYSIRSIKRTPAC